MDERTLGLLELPAILERLAGEAASEPGRALAASLTPSPDPDEVERRHRLTAEAIALLDTAEEPSLEGVRDVRDAAALAARGGVLDPPRLRDVRYAVATALAARRALEGVEAPGLLELAEAIDPALEALAGEIAAAVEDDGSDLRESASPRLRSLRRELRNGRHEAAERLRRLARDPGLREHLQEDFVSERGGRPVLAVRASSRGSVPGIVHDASGSGQTLFVEPFAVVELNNRLSEAASAEREEAERIVRRLSGLAGERAERLEALVDAVGAVDLALACGSLSRRWQGTEVETGDAVRLLAARHPLLDPASAVPIDLDLGDVRALVISGPNTGGKTVALKTLGLAAVLHQCGLRPPAETAVLPVFDRVLADIGDEQSIAMSLSTFSGHVRSLVEILGAATGRSLVLLDEIVAGTDPVEGAALAQALLARLAAQARLTVVTSHYAELKEWASATDGAANAATGFDVETQAPLYRVTLGRPGTSHALRISERLGVPGDVVADARARVAPERLRVAELLAEAETAQRGAVEERAGAERERQGAEQARLAAEARVRELEAEVESVRASAARERERAVADVERELARARAELAGLRDEIREARRQERSRRRAAGGAAAAAERERDRRLGAASERAARARAALQPVEEVPLARPPEPGDPVLAPELGVSGTVVEVEGDEAVVLGHGGLRVRVPVGRLRADPQGGRATPSSEPVVQVRAAATGDAPSELDLRGRTAQEAREAVRAFVDAASLAGRAEVRVVHGRGTGAVRRAVRDELARHPLVESQESESADGATLARLAGS